MSDQLRPEVPVVGEVPDGLSSIRVLSSSPIDEPNLAGSYARAFKAMGCRTSSFSLTARIDAHARLGSIGRRAASLFPVETWIRKGNRDFLAHVFETKPDLVLVPGPMPILPGALAQLKAAMPACRVVLLWPDTLLNLPANTVQCLPVYDLVASYSSVAVPVLKRLGAKDVEWIPFAADPFLFPSDVGIDAAGRQRFACDVTFVGNWRPEREGAVVALISAGIDVKVWGHPIWMKRCRDRRLAERYFRGGPIWGADLARAVRAAKISLNVIDEMNYPAANMRFFESPACGAATLNSNCPEMSQLFPDRKTAFYYRNEKEMVATVQRLLGDDGERLEVAQAAQKQVLSEHTYHHRARALLRRLSLA